jgi:hypothetical protein
MRFNFSKKLFGAFTAVLFLALAVYAFSSTPVSVSAHYGDGGWSSCVSTGAQCGTDNGSQTRTNYQNRGYTWVCPDGYQSHDSNCRKWIDTTYKTVTRYSDKIWHDGQKVCPTSDSYYTHSNPKDCSKQIQIVDVDGHYDYQNKIKQYNACPDGWTVSPSDNDKCQQIETQACHTGTTDYSACTPAGQCPTTCGYTGGTVPNGQGGTVTCAATQACADNRTHVCTDPTATNYVAEPNPDTEVSDNTVCTYPEATLTPTPEVTQAPSNNGGGSSGGDGKSDGLGCGSHDCSGNPQPSSQAVLGASTGPQVLGLSTTSGEENYLLQIFQALGALTSAGLGLAFFKK